MNKSKRIHVDPQNPDQDKYIFFNLEQDISTYEILTLKVDQKDFYQYFNADYGVLIGRVTGNNRIGIPNAKISVFIPLKEEDKYLSNIVSIYPYVTPRDLNADGKRYNLLPRVSTYNQAEGIYKPKQPFGSFPTKEEVVANDNFLEVYKKYYKYTALTNSSGDYMIFGVPTGTQTIHMSVDVTDIGKYSMTPESMVINLGYSPNLFYDNNTKIKPSEDLNILPNIETQEISVDVIPYWGDAENYTIGITRQDFNARAEIKGNFVIFGTTMSMGAETTIGDPDRSGRSPAVNDGFYRFSANQSNTFDVRTYRTSPFTLRVFTFTNDVPIYKIENPSQAIGINYDTQVYELPKDTYYEYNQNGDFLLSIPCNRNKFITDESGNEIPVDDNSPYGIFKNFYGMFILEYPDLTITASFSEKFLNGPSIARVGRGRLKFPQSIALNKTLDETTNDGWRHENQKFEAGKIYSIAQFLPTKWINGNEVNTYKTEWSVNKLDLDVNDIGGVFFKVAGTNDVTQNNYDSENYLVSPTDDLYVYDFPDNAIDVGTPLTNRLFGAQWINLCAVLPQYVWAYRGEYGTDRAQSTADLLFSEFQYGDGTYFTTDNRQPIFAGITNSRNFLSGYAFQTAFIELPSTELGKLNSNQIIYEGKPLQQRKGLNVTLYNQDSLELLDLTPYKYKEYSIVESYNAYQDAAWDIHWSEYWSTPTPKSAYLFKGMYDNNCVKLVFDLNIL